MLIFSSNNANFDVLKLNDCLNVVSIFQKATKWSERKEAVAELTKLASTKRIAPGDFTEVCRTLKKVG